MACAPQGDFVEISVGDGRACAVSASEGLVCWGGRDEWADAQTPEGEALHHIAVGDGHACALTGDGYARCWGPGAPEAIEVPPDVASTELTSVAAGHGFSCGIQADDAAIVCWGINPAKPGCPAAGGPADCAEGALVPPEGAFEAVFLADVYYNACALDVDASLVCWGLRAFSPDVEQPPSAAFQSVAVGASHGCGTTTDARTVCWGAEGEPWTAPPDREFVQLAAGRQHSCGLTASGTVECWGWGPAVDEEPASFVWEAIDAGGDQTCGITEAGGVWCWGLDAEQFTPARAPGQP